MLVTEHIEMNRVPDLMEYIFLLERNICIEAIVIQYQKCYGEGNN